MTDQQINEGDRLLKQAEELYPLGEGYLPIDFSYAELQLERRKAHIAALNHAIQQTGSRVHRALRDRVVENYFNPYPLPTHEEICEKKETKGLNPIEMFLYDNEPVDSEIFRQQLQHAFQFILDIVNS